MKMEPNKPIKRNKYLQSLSRDHHHGLLLCWKIRSGFSKGIEVQRIKRYTDWFFVHHLLPHFVIEEEQVFPILGHNHEFIKRGLMEHRRLKRLFCQTDELEKSLSRIEEELANHIRFEERTLFNEIQNVASEGQLMNVQRAHKYEFFTDNVEDPFWE